MRLYRIWDNARLGTFTTATTLKGSRLRAAVLGDQSAVYWQTDFLDPNGATPAITGHGPPERRRCGTAQLLLSGTLTPTSFKSRATQPHPVPALRS